MARSTSGERRKGAGSTPNGGATTGHEAELWAMADALRGSMDAAEYKHVVLGLIFLKYISDAFEERRAAVLAEWGEDAAENRDEYTAENIFWVPPEARWAHLKAQARQSTVGLTVDAAMAAIERDNPVLEDVLPRDYARPALDKQRPLRRGGAAARRRGTVRDQDAPARHRTAGAASRGRTAQRRHRREPEALGSTCRTTRTDDELASSCQKSGMRFASSNSRGGSWSAPEEAIASIDIQTRREP